MVLNKKGSIRDVGLSAVVLFAFGLVAFLLLFVYNTSTDLMIQSEPFNGTAAGEVIQTHQETLNGMDYIVLAIFLGFFLGVIMLSYLVGGVPVFVAIYIIFFLVISVLSGILTSVWENVSGMVIFGTTINNLPITNFLLNNLTLVIVVTGFVGLIVMYVRGQRLE